MVRADLNNSGSQGAADKWDGSACDGVSSRAARELSGGRSNALISSRLAVGGGGLDGIHAKPGAGGWQQQQPPPASCSPLRPTGRGIPACVAPATPRRLPSLSPLASLSRKEN